MVNNTRRGALVLVALCCLVMDALGLKATFSITKSYIRNPSSQIPLGSLTIIEEDQQNQAYIESNEPVLVSAEELRKYDTIILSFQNQKSGKQYRTAVSANRMASGQHREKIAVVLSSSDEVIGFNYIQAKSAKSASSDISVELQEPEKGVDHVFKVETQKKEAAPEESFFAKYVH